MIPSLDRAHAGFYRCIVRNRVGALMQRRTEVQVASLWFDKFENNAGKAFNRAITLDNTLVILSTVAPDAGRYYVQAVNDKNGENKTSQPITLSVENVGGPADPIAPTIRPLIKLSITWRKDGVLVTSGLSDFNRRLTILSPTVHQSGRYECEAVLRSSSVPSVSAGAYLHILDAPWAVLLANIEPESSAVTVSGLIPARSYQFRICAVNDVGKGQFSKETDRLSLPEEPPSAPPQNVIASGRTNQSIMIQWQPPAESHQNGIIRGYVIRILPNPVCSPISPSLPPSLLRYCLSGLPVGYQYKNITNPDVNNLLLEDLIIWTNYEIEVAAYNEAGLGVHSHTVTEWTLQGVPTVAPGNVHAEAVNSTTIRFSWTAPNPQFINGINQGYKLLAWEPGQEEEVTMVTVRPNFQDSIHVGYIKGLKKFTEYSTSVLCFTTPGDGPRSTAQVLRTHEDIPGPVGHLSFTEILDTSLKVSWREPLEKNGILTGYRISWEEYNRTNTRVTHYLPNVTLQYRVTGLTALTTYTIEVAAMTSQGQGQLSSSTISSGVPPELPGPPTNMAISNIAPRSVTLQFKPGYDGKTSISRWLVEAQLPNEPDARSLEVPNLNPYTFYRKLRGWILENAGLEAQSIPRAVQFLWMMDSERWEAFQREHTPNNLEEGLELVLSYLETAISGTAAQVAGPPAEGKCLLSPSPPAEGKCLLSPSPPAEGKCLLVLPPQPEGEEPERPQPKREEPERPQPKREEPFASTA
ncbi:UNVERIFIED_CONTAM: hypothetical protein FKN15_023041 [Acipenser sinensis]